MNPLTIENISASYMCCNCGACDAICPKTAISFEESNIGRMYAIVDSDKCISCGLCRKVCPSIDEMSTHSTFEDPFCGKVINVYTGRATNEDIFINAQSGGACSATLIHLFNSKKIDAAVVCQMEIGNPPSVRVKIITSVAEISSCQKSCYTPVPILSIIKRISKYKSVAIVGLPCHIEGLESLQRLNKAKNIKYRLGLICDRTLCSTIQDVFGSLSKKVFPNYKIVWRHKLLYHNNLCLQYKNAPVTVSSETGEIEVYPKTYRFFLKDYFTPPRCRVCYDKVNVFADVVFGDPWRLDGINNERGESLIATRSVLGEEIIRELLETGQLECTLRRPIDLFRSQIVDERREQVRAYSKAMVNSKLDINSYLTSIWQGYVENERQIKRAKKDIQEFIKRDTLPKHKIISQAKSIIRLYNLTSKIQSIRLRRIIEKFLYKII